MNQADIEKIIESQGFASYVNTREYHPGDGDGRVTEYHTVYAIQGRGKRRKRHYLGGLAKLAEMSEADLVALIAEKTAKVTK